jgi:large subunit ribosomal protein L24
MAGLRIRKGDTVVVLTGKDKGRTGEVVRAIPTEGKVVVAGVNVAKRHTKPRSAQDQGGIKDKEMPIPVSNVALVDPATGQKVKVAYKVDGDTKVRVNRATGGAL